MARAGRVRTTVAWVVWLLPAAVALGLFATGMAAWIAAEQAQYRTQFGLRHITRRADGTIALEPAWDGSAARSGLLTGDSLLSIDGLPPAPDAALTEAALIPAGAPGSAVTLEVRTGDGPPRSIQVARGGTDGLALASVGVPLNVLLGFMITLETLTAAAFCAAALFIVWRRPTEPVAWLASLMMVLVFVGGISAPVLALYDAARPWRYLLDVWYSVVMGLVILFLCLFPDGRFRPRWGVALVGAWGLWSAAAWFWPALYPWDADDGLALPVVIAWLGGGVAAQLWRYRRHANAERRQQTKWVVWGTAIGLACGVIGIWMVDSWAGSGLLWDGLLFPVGRLFQLLIPVTLIIAVWRYRLWGVDLVINRTLVYATLTALVVATYVLIVGGLGTFLRVQTSAVTGLVATGLIAVLFQPLRERVQRAVNRLLYGQRDDPAAVLTQVAQGLESAASPDAILPNLAQTIGRVLNVPYVGVRLVDGDGVWSLAAAWGTASADTITWPIVQHHATLGQLIVARRGPGERFDRRDTALLQSIAAIAASTVRAVQLSEALRRSRRRIITAREEERRRLRRDLHDGLGPQLASQTLGLDAIDHLMDAQPEKARALLTILKQQAQEAVVDIRRLVYDLRPPALDDLGLVGAIRQSASRYERDGLRIQVIVDDPLPALPAAVEIAIFRIVQESLHNVVRHAAASTVTMALTHAAPHVTLAVSDNGRGLPPDRRSGVGLQSMRERAAELGGRCVIESTATGGTVVRATFPLERDDA